MLAEENDFLVREKLKLEKEIENLNNFVNNYDEKNSSFCNIPQSDQPHYRDEISKLISSISTPSQKDGGEGALLIKLKKL